MGFRKEHAVVRPAGKASLQRRAQRAMVRSREQFVGCKWFAERELPLPERDEREPSGRTGPLRVRC